MRPACAVKHYSITPRVAQHAFITISKYFTRPPHLHTLRAGCHATTPNTRAIDYEIMITGLASNHLHPSQKHHPPSPVPQQHNFVRDTHTQITPTYFRRSTRALFNSIIRAECRREVCERSSSAQEGRRRALLRAYTYTYNNNHSAGRRARISTPRCSCVCE